MCSSSLPHVLCRDPYSAVLECDEQLNMSWCCDHCGVEGRRRLLYTCKICEHDYCVACAMKRGEREVDAEWTEWVDLLGENGTMEGEPEDVEGEAAMKLVVDSLMDT